MSSHLETMPSYEKTKFQHLWKLACFSCREFERDTSSFKLCRRCSKEMTCLRYSIKAPIPSKQNIEGWAFLEAGHEEYLKRLELRKQKQLIKILMR